ncbi:MAG: hypothetical protein ACOY9J_03420 [Pseudomonadota bacterium]
MKKPIPKEVVVKVERAFFLNGEPVPVDTVLKLDYRFAMEMLAANKVSLSTEAPRAPRNAAPAAAAKKP